MNDKNKIITGLIIFVIIATFPFWYNMGKASPAPEIKLSEKAKAAKECVGEFMQAEHMQILDVWRDTVQREGKRIWVSSAGKEYNMSLTKTCLECHGDKAEFCDKCHNYASVRPYCWSCHVDPEEMNYGKK
jgi:hypothetical protein